LQRGQAVGGAAA